MPKMSSKQRFHTKRVTAPRAKSVSDKSTRPQTRTHKSHGISSANVLYETQSENSMLNAVRRLHIQDEKHGSASNTSSRLASRMRQLSAGRGCKSLEDIAQFIADKRAKNIVVMAGAGISTASGIPDFRSPGTGLYDNIKQYNIPYPEAIFDIDYFESYPRPFYLLAKELYPNGTYPPNYIHYFLRLLNDKGILLRVYTQNIDGLERIAGIPPQKLVEAHGNFLTVSCIKCKQHHDANLIKDAIFDDKLPRCMRNGCTGLVKPDIVFFGEDLPRRFYYYLKDFPQADLLLVMGTSLEVEPFAGIIDSVRFFVPRVLFNRNVIGPFAKKKRVNDVVAKGDIIEQLKLLVGFLGWEGELEALMTREAEVLKNKHLHSEVKGEKKSNGESKSCATSDIKDKTSANDKTPPVMPLKQKPPQAVITASSLLRRQPVNNGMIANVQDIAAVKRMLRLTGLKNPRINSADGSHAEPSKTILPRIGQRMIPFHTQRSLFRTQNPKLMQVESSSEEESSSSSDSDD